MFRSKGSETTQTVAISAFWQTWPSTYHFTREGLYWTLFLGWLS